MGISSKFNTTRPGFDWLIAIRRPWMMLMTDISLLFGRIWNSSSSVAMLLFRFCFTNRATDSGSTCFSSVLCKALGRTFASELFPAIATERSVRHDFCSMQVRTSMNFLHCISCGVTAFAPTPHKVRERATPITYLHPPFHEGIWRGEMLEQNLPSEEWANCCCSLSLWRWWWWW